MFFAVALALVVLLPLAVTAIAYDRAKSHEQSVPVTRWRSARRPRRPRDVAYTWGTGLGIVCPYLAAALLHVMHAPEGLGGLLFLVTVLVCWSIHVFTRHRTSFFGAVPWGMVLGSFAMPFVIGLVLLPVLTLAGF